jgi:hypothetical protein
MRRRAWSSLPPTYRRVPPTYRRVPPTYRRVPLTYRRPLARLLVTLAQ